MTNRKKNRHKCALLFALLITSMMLSSCGNDKTSSEVSDKSEDVHSQITPMPGTPSHEVAFGNIVTLEDIVNYRNENLEESYNKTSHKDILAIKKDGKDQYLIISDTTREELEKTAGIHVVFYPQDNLSILSPVMRPQRSIFSFNHNKDLLVLFSDNKPKSEFYLTKASDIHYCFPLTLDKKGNLHSFDFFVNNITDINIDMPEKNSDEYLDASIHIKDIKINNTDLSDIIDSSHFKIYYNLNEPDKYSTGVILLDSGKDVSMKFDLYGEQVKATVSPAIIFENNRYVSTDLDYREYPGFYIYNVSSWFDSLDDKKDICIIWGASLVQVY